MYGIVCARYSVILRAVDCASLYNLVNETNLVYDLF
jgi:hypothetical protein